MKPFIRDSLELYINNSIKKVANIYKEVDFNIDIDVDKSGYYLLDDYELQFIFNKKIYDLKNSNPCVRMYADKYRYIYNYILERDSILVFQYRNNNLVGEEGIGLYIGNDIFKNQIETISYPQKFIRTDSFYIALSINKNFSCFCYSFEENYKYSTRNINKKLNNYIIDMYNKELYINGVETKLLNKENRFIIDKYSLRNVVISYTGSNIHSDFPINDCDLIIGKIGKGIIYLNPIKLVNVNKIRVYLIYKGNISLEFSNNYGNWEKADNKIIRCDNSILNLRINIDNYSKIYKIYILNED